jgi:hypothetical protein
MSRLIPGAAASVRGRPQERPLRPDERLRALAARVRHLGLGGRFDPERAVIEREDVARQLYRLARDLEPVPVQPQPSRPPAAATTIPRPERLLALLAHKSKEITRLEALLTEAARPRPRHRQRSSAAQLVLPLQELRHTDPEHKGVAAGSAARRRNASGSTASP